VNLRGGLLPVLDLRTLYALEGPAPASGSVVVVRIGTRRFGVMVDSLLGQHQTVIKPLGRLLRSLRGMSGSSILGTGEVALIFDVDALGRLAMVQAASHATHPNWHGGTHPTTNATDLTSAGERS
jgi:two-component system, chemotaxis family, sensor kinase CheA